MIEREKVLANNLLIGDKDSPTYSYKNRNLRSGSLKGSFSLDPIVNELAVDTFQFTVHYDPDAQMIAYSPVDMGTGVYRCAPDGSETGQTEGDLETSGWLFSVMRSTVSGNDVIIPNNTTTYNNANISIAPPTNVSATRNFVDGDEIKLKITVNELSRIGTSGTPGMMIGIGRGQQLADIAEITSSTGLFEIVYLNDYLYARTFSLGEDTLTVKYFSTRSNISIMGDWYESGRTRFIAKFSIDGMMFNNDTIYGFPKGKVYLCRPTNPIPLDKYLTDVPYGTPVWWMCEES